MTLESIWTSLCDLIRERAGKSSNGMAAVALSGGRDSALLLDAAVQALGHDRVVAITLHTPLAVPGEIDSARGGAGASKVKWICLELDFQDLPAVLENGPDRCYFCKQSILRALFQEAGKQGANLVLEGTNPHELATEHRPGFRAVREFGALSPYVELNLSREQIADLALWRGIAAARSPSQSCLATRIPTGTAITPELLNRIGQFEKQLTDRGFKGFRARWDQGRIRLETPVEQIDSYISEPLRSELLELCFRLGFNGLLLDLAGYRPSNPNLEEK